jgi:hypothetical protein
MLRQLSTSKKIKKPPVATLPQHSWEVRTAPIALLARGLPFIEFKLGYSF